MIEDLDTPGAIPISRCLPVHGKLAGVRDMQSAVNNMDSELCGNLLQKAVPRACLPVFDGLSFVQSGKSNRNRPKRLRYSSSPA